MPSRAGYARAVACAVDELKAGELRKVVLARALRLTMAAPVDVRTLLANLVSDNAAGFTYAVDLPADDRPQDAGRRDPRDAAVPHRHDRRREPARRLDPA